VMLGWATSCYAGVRRVLDSQGFEQKVVQQDLLVFNTINNNATQTNKSEFALRNFELYRGVFPGFCFHRYGKPPRVYSLMTFSQNPFCVKVTYETNGELKEPLISETENVCLKDPVMHIWGVTFVVQTEEQVCYYSTRPIF
ncbi:MAG: hypothetical protein NTW04_05185, partial [Elusimicrobia bacterium]|nr:hypothetical protein [Elusimicrobiota bacterium]